MIILYEGQMQKRSLCDMNLRSDEQTFKNCRQKKR